MTYDARILHLEFRYRIVVSLTIAFLACIIAYGVWEDVRPFPETLIGPIGRTSGFLLASLLCLAATVLRMTAGSALRSARIMSFEVRPEKLVVSPPYNLVRNPIYLADLIAAAGLALCMPFPGILFPALLGVHYLQLIRYEEGQLSSRHGGDFSGFLSSVPRLLPSGESISSFLSGLRACRIDRDGARYNALYLLFVPGLWVAAVTGEFFHAVIVGLPAVADWAYWHTVKGLPAPHREVYHEQ